MKTPPSTPPRLHSAPFRTSPSAPSPVDPHHHASGSGAKPPPEAATGSGTAPVLPAGRWRIVGAWAAHRRPHEAPLPSAPTTVPTSAPTSVPTSASASPSASASAGASASASASAGVASSQSPPSSPSRSRPASHASQLPSSCIGGDASSNGVSLTPSVSATASASTSASASPPLDVNATLMKKSTVQLPQPQTVPRKRVSLFLRRRRSAQPFHHPSAATSTAGAAAPVGQAQVFLSPMRRRSSFAAPLRDTDDGESDANGERRDDGSHDGMAQCRLRRAYRSVGARLTPSSHAGVADHDIGDKRRRHAGGGGDSLDDGDGEERVASIRLVSSDERRADATPDAGRNARASGGGGEACNNSGRSVCKGAARGEGDSSDSAGDIIGEICLEDFADGDDDYAFLDGESIDLSFEPMGGGNSAAGGGDSGAGGGARMGGMTSVTMGAGELRWIGDEQEFAKFFAEVGLDDLFDVEEQQWAEFRIEEAVAHEWRADGEEHNRQCGEWLAGNGAAAAASTAMAVDIRQFAHDYGEAVRQRLYTKDRT